MLSRGLGKRALPEGELAMFHSLCKNEQYYEHLCLLGFSRFESQIPAECLNGLIQAVSTDWAIRLYNHPENTPANMRKVGSGVPLSSLPDR